MKCRPEWAGPANGSAYQHNDIEPDIITMAKALGGGVAIGAMMAKAGNRGLAWCPANTLRLSAETALACAAGIAVIEAIEEENLLENAVKMGKYAREKLEQIEAKTLHNRPCSRNRPDDWRSA